MTDREEDQQVGQEPDDKKPEQDLNEKEEDKADYKAEETKDKIYLS